MILKLYTFDDNDTDLDNECFKNYYDICSKLFNGKSTTYFPTPFLLKFKRKENESDSKLYKVLQCL